jgi:hypothetical protein
VASEETANRMLISRIVVTRVCRVSIRDVDGITHTVEVTAGSLFEAAGAALSAFRQHAWAATSLTPAATLRVEVQMPAIVHDVPLKAVERWLAAPSASPRDESVKRDLRRLPGTRRSGE